MTKDKCEYCNVVKNKEDLILHKGRTLCESCHYKEHQDNESYHWLLVVLSALISYGLFYLFHMLAYKTADIFTLTMQVIVTDVEFACILVCVYWLILMIFNYVEAKYGN
jgi:hypothetical protein